MKRILVLFVLIAMLLGTLVYAGIKTKENRFTPDLALDLEGGTQLILTPVSTDGSQITQDDVNQAIEIIRQRVDASGVAEAEISAQGGHNIVVAIPGAPKKETLDLVRTSAVLRLRPVIGVLAPKAVDSKAIAQMKAAKAGEKDVQKAAASAPKLTSAQIDRELTAIVDANGNGKVDSKPASDPKNGSDQAWITEQLMFDAYRLDCGSKAARIKGTSDNPKTGIASCSSDGKVKYLLGPAEIEGTNLTKASSNLATDSNGNPSGGWAVSMQFDAAGAKKFAEVTGRIYKMKSPLNQFAIVLDGQVISAPVPNGPIVGGQAQITGNFKAAAAASLANQLSFGSLPLNFEVQSEEQISATLGSEQLYAGLVAGLIGLIVIVLYMLWHYHALGVISVLSIILSTGLSYFVICLLSWVMGYRLSMAGVLGMIISIGVTADSFIVYFERIRDEMRDGRNVPGAIFHGWERAKRTIIISDCVNLIASTVLFILTVGSVRGFAFTLGVTTVLDLLVVMMFTYPLMELFGHTDFFGQGRRFSGLNREKLTKTPLYRGRGRIADRRGSADYPAGKTAENRASGSDLSDAEDAHLSLAERKAKERRAEKAAALKGMTDKSGGTR
ncbi:protein translocase subunit SecD [Arcanobacterium sp. S3PF19]|uniref:protein translocase subunit SecD n=1 Tax=Arcanobacterium sp. S3PF19 TaxID=1219585 RepID=UPI001E3740F5|nr:protein translocase subunit SecD [Arcanobacterium sp. S3PF19]